MPDDENYTAADYRVTTSAAPKNKFVGTIVNAKTGLILHGCRHKHDDRKTAMACIREMMRVNNWKINIIN